ncbi:hypothetical protein [Achromobacter sp. UMC71]|uniref:hypothetical protein n=1 Tax=Achromobacter sp. UMC71 TaxID=1862320 RepID=UPI001604446D|nr:hypothetical protein [Achromobacter sp. UMC71]MBB1628771.1 hypothetical protein [Achromobacter sp. UMC71]
MLLPADDGRAGGRQRLTRCLGLLDDACALFISCLLGAFRILGWAAMGGAMMSGLRLKGGGAPPIFVGAGVLAE